MPWILNIEFYGKKRVFIFYIFQKYGNMFHYIMENPKVIFQRGQSWGSRCVRIAAVAKALSTGNAKESSSRGPHIAPIRFFEGAKMCQVYFQGHWVPWDRPQSSQARAKAKAARCRSRWGVMKKAVVGCVVHPG